MLRSWGGISVLPVVLLLIKTTTFLKKIACFLPLLYFSPREKICQRILQILYLNRAIRNRLAKKLRYTNAHIHPMAITTFDILWTQLSQIPICRLWRQNSKPVSVYRAQGIKGFVKNRSAHFRKCTTGFLCSKRSKFEIRLFISFPKWAEQIFLERFIWFVLGTRKRLFRHAARAAVLL